jgi:5-methylcytosine-specific restriction enzyme subunit McrC
VIRIELEELGPPVERRLTVDQGRWLRASGVVVAVMSSHDVDIWSIRAAGKVGVVQIGDVEVRIRPKVLIDRLLFLLGYAIKPGDWREDDVTVAAVDDLVPALAQALWRQVERAVLTGLLQGYRMHDDAAQVLRGRLRETDQMRRRHGLAVPLEVRYDEFTVDIAENQILRAAAERMLRLPRVDVVSRLRLRHLLSRFTDVRSLPPGQPVPAWTPSRLNARYHTALRLAELVLRGASVEHAVGGVTVNGFLLDMPRLFEDFVTVALPEALRPYGGRAVPQDRHHLDTGARIRIQPDLVWHAAGAPAAVVDAKYKAEKPSGFPDADLYQMLAYCTALRLPRGHLIYAKGNEQPATHVVRNAEVEIVCHALDLGASPATLLAKIAKPCGHGRFEGVMAQFSRTSHDPALANTCSMEQAAYSACPPGASPSSSRTKSPGAKAPSREFESASPGNQA